MFVKRYDVVKIFGNGVKIAWNKQNREGAMCTLHAVADSARACRIRQDHEGLGLGSRWEEINTVEKIEGDKVYEVMYIMGMKPQGNYNRGPVGRTQSISRM